jgi:hypothetical protein
MLTPDHAPQKIEKQLENRQQELGQFLNVRDHCPAASLLQRT